MLRQIRSIRHSVTRSLFLTLVSSLIIPRLDYCISVFSGLSSCQIHRLKSILKAFARLLFNASRFSSITPLLRSLNWLPVKYRVHLCLSTLVFLCRQNRVPQYSSELKDPAAQVRRPNLRSSCSGKLMQPKIRRPTLGGRAFLVAGIRVLNALPEAVRSANDVRDFKRKLKRHLLADHFT